MYDIRSIKSFDVFSFEVKGEPKGLGFVINGVPYLLWTHVYQNLEMTRQHARKLVLGLKEGTQVILISNEQMNALNTRVNGAFTLGFSTPVYYFVTAEGFNRALMEVDTSGMKDKKIAAAIEKRKNEMAKVFTEYQNGTLALPEGKRSRTGKKPELSFVQITPVLKDYIAAGRSLGLDKRTVYLKAIELTERKTGEDLSTYKDEIPVLPATKRGALYTSTAVAEKFGKGKHAANKFMEDNGLLIKIGKEYGFTQIGEKYGEMVPITIVTGSGRITKYAPRWKLEVIDYLRKTNPLAGQKTLS